MRESKNCEKIRRLAVLIGTTFQEDLKKKKNFHPTFETCISIELQALEKENTKLSFDTQIGEIKVATGLLIRSRPTFLCAPLSIIARANVQGSTDWRRPVIFRRIRAVHPPPLRPRLVNPKFHFLPFLHNLVSLLPLVIVYRVRRILFSLLSTALVFTFAENYSRILSADSKEMMNG